jgi:hypothetical protein
VKNAGGVNTENCVGVPAKTDKVKAIALVYVEMEMDILHPLLF